MAASGISTKKLPISKIPRVAVAEANVPCEKPQGFSWVATPRKTSCCSFWWSWKSTLDMSLFFFFREKTSVFFYQFDSTSEMLRGDVYKNDLMQTYLVDVLSTHPIWTKSMRLGQNVESSYPTFVSKKNPNIFVTLKVRPLSRSL